MNHNDRVSAIVQTHVRLMKLNTDEWNDYLLDAEDDIFGHIVARVPAYSDNGTIFVGVVNHEDWPTARYLFFLGEDEREAEDTFNDTLSQEETLMGVYKVDWEVMNEFQDTSIV